jgi:hypothetical protein
MSCQLGHSIESLEVSRFGNIPIKGSEVQGSRFKVQRIRIQGIRWPIWPDGSIKRHKENRIIVDRQVLNAEAI